MSHSYTAEPCAPPTAASSNESNAYGYFGNRFQFELGEFLYKSTEMPGAKIDELMELWAADVMEHGRTPPFANHEDLHLYVPSLTVALV
jgi:hypothetical protein